MHVPGSAAERGDGSTVTVTGSRQKAAWAEHVLPPVEHLAGDIWSLPVPIPDNPLRYTLCYVVPSDSGLVVVDPGWDSTKGWDALCDGLASAGATPADVTGIVITHIHPDHHGMSARLKAASDAWVAMHPAERDSLPHRQFQHEKSRAEAARNRLREAGAPESDVRELFGTPDEEHRPDSAPDLVEPDLLLEDGSPVALDGRDLVALWTPGHTPGHLCLVEPTARVVLTGDHILPRITPNIGLHGRRPGQTPLADFMDSLKRLASWDDHEALPAHEYRFRGLAARTEQLLDHHTARLSELLEVVGELGQPTLWEATAHISWSRPWDQVGAMRFAALAETEAHVQHLTDLGLLIRSDENGRPVRLRRAPVA
ncbi:MBL fold metallo-hydrolase [Streptomyces sp. NPDC090088]|uniref:MBL fold metallo-hydrolase n=1 Tax=Streptomyces sp. NPDC090088 TaxID=3365944 RepID=UPI003811E712